MKIAVPAEADPAEPRVAATPDTVKKLKALGAEVVVETGAKRLQLLHRVRGGGDARLCRVGLGGNSDFHDASEPGSRGSLAGRIRRGNRPSGRAG